MTSTLCARKTPEPTPEWRFKSPIKEIVAARLYGNSDLVAAVAVTVGYQQLQWFEGVVCTLRKIPMSDREELKRLERLVQILREDGSVNFWIEKGAGC